MPYGNFYYGKTGFFFKKSGVIGARYNPSLGAICNQPQDVNNRFVPGSGVGASSTAQRRAKLIQAYRTVAQKDGKGPQHLGVFSQGGSNAYALNWGLYNSPYVGPAPPVILSAPTNLLQTSSTTTTITFTFTPPDSRGSTITNYEYSIDGGSTFTAFSPAQTTSPVTISGLTGNTTYTVQLKAVNSSGAGEASATMTGITADFQNVNPPGSTAYFYGNDNYNDIVNAGVNNTSWWMSGIGSNLGQFFSKIATVDTTSYPSVFITSTSGSPFVSDYYFLYIPSTP